VVQVSAVASAEKSLLIDSNNNELLTINLAMVRADGILFPVLHKCVAVIGHLKTTLQKMKFKNYKSAIHNFTHSFISIDYMKSGRLAVNVLIDLFNLHIEPKATFDFINKTINPRNAESIESRQLFEDYLNWLPEHFSNHNCDLTKLKKLEITFWADIDNAATPKGMNNSKEFTVHAITKWKAENKGDEIIEISQTEIIKENFLKLRIPEF
jgi:hypothetical protein